jgi:hypothetical protein
MKWGNGIDQRIVLSVIRVGHEGEECRDDPYSVSDRMIHNVKLRGDNRGSCCCCCLLMMMSR